jgi:hypothetical protein
MERFWFYELLVHGSAVGFVYLSGSEALRFYFLLNTVSTAPQIIAARHVIELALSKTTLLLLFAVAD